MASRLFGEQPPGFAVARRSRSRPRCSVRRPWAAVVGVLICALRDKGSVGPATSRPRGTCPTAGPGSITSQVMSATRSAAPCHGRAFRRKRVGMASAKDIENRWQITGALMLATLMNTLDLDDRQRRPAAHPGQCFGGPGPDHLGADLLHHRHRADDAAVRLAGAENRPQTDVPVFDRRLPLLGFLDGLRHWPRLQACSRSFSSACCRVLPGLR